jgi:dephospho-CoA kinase
MLRVALTGGIGSGKSLVGEIFSGLGAIVVDSDQLARQVIEPGTKGFALVDAEFGDQILVNGKIDRKKLASIVFNDPVKRSRLEAIVHPLVRSAFEEIASAADENTIVINQIPLLVETGGAKSFDVVISVSSPLELRKERLRQRGMSESENEARIRAQASDEERRSISDFEIVNDSTTEALEKKCAEIFQVLKSRASNH